LFVQVLAGIQVQIAELQEVQNELKQLNQVQVQDAPVAALSATPNTLSSTTQKADADAGHYHLEERMQVGGAR
jgi:hypothetical protein